jgi:hypothetical protein
MPLFLIIQRYSAHSLTVPPGGEVRTSLRMSGAFNDCSLETWQHSGGGAPESLSPAAEGIL